MSLADRLSRLKILLDKLELMLLRVDRYKGGYMNHNFFAFIVRASFDACSVFL